MFKEKNVKRRQDVLNLSSIGSLIPRLYIQRPRMWGAWIAQIPKIVRHDHPFGKLPLRATNHARMGRGVEAWAETLSEFLQWPDESAQGLGIMLIDAAKWGDPTLVRDLLAEKASVTEVDGEGETALVKAMRNGRVDVVELLLANNADITAQDRDGVAMLHLAIREDNEMLKMLFRRGIDFGIWGQGLDVLPIALCVGNSEAVQLLLDGGAATTRADYRFLLSLATAALAGHEMAVLLLGAQDNTGLTVLHIPHDNTGSTVLHTALKMLDVNEKTATKIGWR